MLNLLIAAVLTKEHNYIRGMLDADRAMSRVAYQVDIAKAFRESFDGGTVVLAPKVEPGTEWLASKPFEPKDKIFWDVNRAEVSLKGEFGYTSGAWTLKRKGEYTNGDYIRVWKKVGHDWKIALQADVSTGLPRVALGEVIIPKPPKLPKSFVAKDDLQDSLSSAELEIATHKDSASGNYTADAYFLRSGLPPVVGLSPALTALQTKPIKEFFLVDRKSDLACSYGELDSEESPRPFLRIWRWTPPSGWKVSLEYIGGPPVLTFKGIPPLEDKQPAKGMTGSG